MSFIEKLKDFFTRKPVKQAGLVFLDGAVEAFGAYARATREVYDDLLYGFIRAKLNEFKEASDNPEKLAQLAASLPLHDQRRIATAIAGEGGGDVVA